MVLWKYKYFVDVIDSKSFTKAGKKNFVSQTAISQQISSLEKSIGGKLIDRGNGEIVVTELGQIVYDKAKEMLRLNEEMAEEIQQFKEKPTFDIGVDCSINRLFWEKIQKMMKNHYSGAIDRFGFAKIDPRIGCKMLEDNNLDIFIGYDLQKIGKENAFEEVDLCENRIGVFLGRNTSIKGKKELTLEDLKGHTRFESRVYPCSIQETEMDEEAHISQTDVKMDDNIDTMKLKVEFNDGYAFADSRFFSYEDGEIRLLSDFDKPCTLKLFYKKEKNKKKIERFLTQLQRVI